MLGAAEVPGAVEPVVVVVVVVVVEPLVVVVVVGVGWGPCEWGGRARALRCSDALWRVRASL